MTKTWLEKILKREVVCNVSLKITWRGQAPLWKTEHSSWPLNFDIALRLVTLLVVVWRCMVVDEGGHGHSEVYALAVFRCWTQMEYVLISYSRRYQKRMVLLDQICSLGIQKHLHSWVKNNPKSMTAGLWQWSSWDRLQRPDTCIADNNGLSLCWMWKRSSYCFLHSYREPERQVFMYYLLYVFLLVKSHVFIDMPISSKG